MVNKPKRKSPQQNDPDQLVKQKKQRTAPTNTSLLPPCKVCQEPAAGFHYGVNTCEACKGFFRRTLVREGQYECINGDEKCDIIQVGKNGKKRICPRCRHLKCLEVGMSQNAIKTGRYTHAKRTQDILEYRQVMGLSDDSSCASPAVACTASEDASTTTTTTLMTSSSATTVPFSSAAGTPKSSNSSNSASYSNTAPIGIQPPAIENMAVSWDSSSLSPQECESTSQYTALSSVKLSALQTSVDSNSSSFAASARVVSSGTVKSCVGIDVSGPFGSPQLSYPASAQSFFDNILDHMAGGESGRCDESLSLSSKDSNTPTPLSVVSSPECSTQSTVEKTDDDLSDEECRRLTAHLLQSHEKLLISKYEFTAEEMLEKQRTCFENCKARLEAFGPMGGLSEEEYQEVYQTTGIDVDDRQAFITVLSKMLDDTIRQFISFVKTIPGFSQLSMKDQIRLIKDNRCEVGAICQTSGYNHELKVMTMPSGRSFCEHDMEKIGGKERTKERFRVLHAIQQLGLSEDEKVLFKCMVLFTLGNDDVDEPEKVSAIQWKIAQCLLWLLRENKRPSPNLFFANIINAFLRTKDLANSFYEWVKSKPFEHYTQFKNNELLAEWFSNS